MAERLQWIKRTPKAWADWDPIRGGTATHALVRKHYPQARVYIVEDQRDRLAMAQDQLGPRGWRKFLPPPLREGRGGGTVFDHPPPGSVEMLWSNMELHMAADPQSLMRQWHQALAVDGFLMFTCLGPDTLKELRAVYAQQGWPPPAHEFTDMHDWGDMLVHQGFAEPVMDMERIRLGFDSAERLLEELRGLGANLHPDRFAGLRGRGWRRRLEHALDRGARGADGKLTLTFEVIYGHALKPLPRARVGEQSAVSLADMKTMLGASDRAGRR